MASACGGGHHRASPPAAPVTSTRAPAPAAAPATPTAEMSVGLDARVPSNWNVLSAAGAGPALAQVVDQVWPSVFRVGPSFVPVLDTTLMSSATETSLAPQTVVYHLNPKAVWSDGTPITGADFVYTWQAQAGRPGRTDTGGHPFTPASTAGYGQIRSVTVAPGDADVVTVVWDGHDADWPALFSPLIPAHVAERIGFDRGFTDPVTDLVSGGPFVVSSFDPGGSVRLVRNPGYWGRPAAALALDFHFLPDAHQAAAAVAAGQLSCALLPATAAILSPLRASRSLAVHVGLGPGYLSLDLRQRSGPLASATKRAAVTTAVDRAAVVAATVGAVEPGAAPVANRFLVPGQPGYAAHAPPPASPATTGAGTTIRLVSGTDPLSVAAARVVTTDLQTAGFAVIDKPVDSVAAAETGTGWDAALAVRPLSPFPGPELLAYQAGSAANHEGFSNAAVTELVRAAAATTGTARLDLVNQIDAAAGAARADLPLVALPEAVACQASVVNVGPNPAPQGPAYNADTWGMSAGAP